MAYLNLYKNNPTAGGVDGNKVVAGNPVITPYLDLVSGETANIKLALRCDAGFASLQPTVITPASTATTLSAEALADALTIVVESATGLQVGNLLDIGAGETIETKRIIGIDGSAITLNSALDNTQALGAAVSSRSKYQIALALDVDGVPGTFGEWGAALTVSATIAAVNTIIWAQVRALAADVVPYKDASSWLAIAYKVGEAA